MALIPHVQPGEVIRSSVFNALIDFVNAGGTAGPAPSGVLVPDLFGRTLSQARTMLNDPSVNLALGATLDAFGAAVDPNLPASATRLVLGQAPSAGLRALAGSPVNLVLNAQGTTSTPPPPPTFTQTETLLGAVATSFRVGETFVLVGTNFSTTPSQNTVTFDGTPATSIQSDPANASQRLIVIVPVGIPGAPVAPGDPDKPSVTVAISRQGSAPATRTITVQAPSAQPGPANIAFSPAVVLVGGTVTITGQNFSATQSNNIVTLAGTGATVNSSSPTQITITVPDLPGLGPLPDSELLVKVMVTVTGIGSGLSQNNLTVVRP